MTIKNRRSAIFWVAAVTVASTMTAYAQNSIQIFSPVNVRLSANGTSASSPVNFSTSTQTLNCPSSGITAMVASTADGTGNVLVDNFINLTVTQGQSTTGPVNICRGGVVENGNAPDCFTTGYQTPAANGQLTGQDPDNFTSTGGVAPIDISASLAAGTNQVQLALVDTGGYLASSSIYLVTNCTQAGVSGPATISGNPISSNPTPDELVQGFPFDSGDNQNVEQIYDLSVAQSNGDLTIQDGTIPSVADSGIDPAMWQPHWVAGTSFATSECLIHNGELLNGQPACKLYTVTCQVGQGSTGSGAQCPVSTVRNEVFEDSFDGPAFTLPDIHNPHGPTFHQGIGYLMASEGWMGGVCAFDPASGLQDQSCPMNFLTFFSGPGLYSGRGTTEHPNSSFIMVAPVPEDLTRVKFPYCRSEKWTNSRTVKAHFSSRPPVVPPPNNGFTASPIASITYGIALAANEPSTEFPIPTDVVLTNPVGCPAPGSPGTAKKFNAGEQTIAVPADGQYLLHYFATDCAGTEELRFTQDTTGTWSTSFYTRELNVDTVAPQVVYGPILSPAPSYIHGILGYRVGQKVKVTYQCSDDLSGVDRCGQRDFPEGTTLTPQITTQVDTSCAGSKTFTVNVSDHAHNQGQPVSVDYEVVR